jgi:acetyltransferase EpsM
VQLIVIGHGGHSKVIRDLVQEAYPSMRIAAYLDDKYKEWTPPASGEAGTGPLSMVRLLREAVEGARFVVAVGHNGVRERLVAALQLPDDCYATLIHAAAVVSPSARLGCGSVVMARAVVNADAVIGSHSIINTGAVVEHDAQLEDYVHIAPQAALTGDVRVRKGGMIGAGAAVIPGKSIGEWATVGAGATVITDIPAYATAVGTPAQVIETSIRKVVTAQCQH